MHQGPALSFSLSFLLPPLRLVLCRAFPGRDEGREMTRWIKGSNCSLPSLPFSCRDPCSKGLLHNKFHHRFTAHLFCYFLSAANAIPFSPDIPFAHLSLSPHLLPSCLRSLSLSHSRSLTLSPANPSLKCSPTLRLPAPLSRLLALTSRLPPCVCAHFPSLSLISQPFPCPCKRLPTASSNSDSCARP